MHQNNVSTLSGIITRFLAGSDGGIWEGGDCTLGAGAGVTGFAIHSFNRDNTFFDNIHVDKWRISFTSSNLLYG